MGSLEQDDTTNTVTRKDLDIPHYPNHHAVSAHASILNPSRDLHHASDKPLTFFPTFYKWVVAHTVWEILARDLQQRRERRLVPINDAPDLIRYLPRPNVNHISPRRPDGSQ